MGWIPGYHRYADTLPEWRESSSRVRQQTDRVSACCHVAVSAGGWPHWWYQPRNCAPEPGAGRTTCCQDPTLCSCNHTPVHCVAVQTKIHRHTHTRLTAPFPGLPRWAGTRKAKPIWILMKQETVSGSGISWATCKSAPRSRQMTMPAPHHSVFYRPNALPATQPTASKHWKQKKSTERIYNLSGYLLEALWNSPTFSTMLCGTPTHVVLCTSNIDCWPCYQYTTNVIAKMFKMTFKKNKKSLKGKYKACKKHICSLKLTVSNRQFIRQRQGNICQKLSITYSLLSNFLTDKSLTAVKFPQLARSSDFPDKW